MNSSANEFLTSISRTISRMNLYPMNHPLVRESVNESFTLLNQILADEKELILSWTENKLLLNGNQIAGSSALESTLGSIFEKLSLTSLTFQPGIALEELTSFYKLFRMSQGKIKSAEDLKTFLQEENIAHIQPDVAFFTKIGSKGYEIPKDRQIETGGDGKGTQERESSQFVQWSRKLQTMSLENQLWELVQKTVPDPEQQKQIYEIIFIQLQNEIKQKVAHATEKIEKEKKTLALEQERTNSVVTNISQGAIMVDQDGKVVMMNSAAERIYGAPLSAVKGKKISEAVKEDVLVALSKEIAAPSQAESAKEVELQSSEDVLATIRASSAVIQNPDGKIVGIVSTLTDIARQKELQRMQNDFMAHVTHELRSPLTSIKASLGTLFSEEESNPLQKHMMEIANRNIERLTRLINDLLDAAKIGSGKLTLYPKPVSPIALLKEAGLSLSPWAEKKGVSLQLKISETLPTVLVDSDRITQVIVNLISNAIKFTPAGGKITLEAQPLNSLFLRLSVSDTGIGMPKEKQSHLFERFYQLPQKQKTDTPGTGLGLFISKSIVELHHGEIWVESEEGKGATFFFTLPIAQQVSVPEVALAGEQKIEKKKSWLTRLFGR